MGSDAVFEPEGVVVVVLLEDDDVLWFVLAVVVCFSEEEVVLLVAPLLAFEPVEVLRAAATAVERDDLTRNNSLGAGTSEHASSASWSRDSMVVQISIRSSGTLLEMSSSFVLVVEVVLF